MIEKKLLKSAVNRMICGVCGGIGEYFNVDPTVIRLIWVILSFFSAGAGKGAPQWGHRMLVI